MSKVTDCLIDLQTLAQSVAWVGTANRVSICLTPLQLQQLIKGCNGRPGIGVLYEGRSAAPEADKLGRSTRALFAFYLILSDGGFVAFDSVSQSVEYLNDLRTAVLGQRNSAGNLWTFVAESFLESRDGYIIWQQRWSTAITD